MPQANIVYKEQVSTILPSAANSFAIAGVCSKGDPTRAYTFETSQIDQVNDVLGDGTGCEATVTMLRYGKRTVTFFPLAPTVDGSISSVMVTGGAPAVTAAAIAASGDVLIDGPYDTLDIALKIVKTGAADVARFRWCLDDQVKDGEHIGSFQGEIVVPIAKAAEVIGSVDVSTLAYGSGGDLDGLTLVIDSDTTTPITITFSAPANKAAVLSQINTGNGAKFIADYVGANKLRIRSITTGSSGSIRLTGDSTALSVLGFAIPTLDTAATPAVITGTVALTSGALFGNGGTLDGGTFIVTSDLGSVTTTFVDPADAAAVANQINAVASGSEFIASINGSTHLVITSTTEGSAGTLLIGAGNKNSALGFTGSATDTGDDATYTGEPSATGTAATYDLPGTGVRLTFPAGTYPLGAVYTLSTVAPRITSDDLPALRVRVQAHITAGGQIGTLWPTQEDADAIESRAMADTFSAELAAARASHFAFWGLYQVAGEDTDADVLLRCGSFIDGDIALSAGSFRAMGGALPGSRFRRPWSWWCAWKAARDRMSSDLGNHSDGRASTDNGFTEIMRDERTATTKLATFRTPQTGIGGGFLVAESTTFGEVYTYQGRTMAADGSIYGDLSASRIKLAVGRQMQRDLDFEINNDLLLTKSGVLADPEVDRIKNRLEAGVNSVLFEDVEAPGGHASAFAVSDPVYTKNTRTLSASYEVQRRGPAKAVTGELAISDTLSTTQGA